MSDGRVTRIPDNGALVSQEEIMTHATRMHDEQSA